MRIIYSKTKYAGEFVVEDHHTGEVLVFVRDRREIREPTPILIHPGNPTTALKERMVLKDNK